MGLEAVSESIRQQAEDESAEILAEAQNEADRIRSQAQQDAERIREETREEIARSARPEEIRLKHETAMALRKIKHRAVDEVFRLVVERVEDRLRGLRDQGRYQEALRGLIHEARQALEPSLQEDEGWELVVDERDLGIVREMMREQNQDVEIQAGDIDMGGAIVRSEDGRVVVDNSFAARLEQSLPGFRQDFLTRTLGSDQG